ncbi:MAG: hypothetical protein ACYCXW_06330 [Solirubrobacteraceae bacterium]
MELLAGVRRSGDIDYAFAALLLCTCQRWDRVTGKLIAATEAADLLCGDELDELAEAFLTDEVEVIYPLAWVSPEWLEIDLDDPASSRTVLIDEDTPARASRRIEPPLRRWASRRLLRVAPRRLTELIATAERLDTQARAAPILGLLDSSVALDASERRRLMAVGLTTGIARVRIAALEVMCELDGVEAAVRRASDDRDAKVRSWRPRIPAAEPALRLL